MERSTPRVVGPTRGSGPEPLWREAVGARLRRMRLRRRLTLAEVAAAAGISPQYLSEIERGLKDPSSEMLAAGAGVVDVTSLAATDLRHRLAWPVTSSTTVSVGPSCWGAATEVLLAA
ncbi:hypothetical protein GCM10027517_36800 [Phycicoccus ginsengisoli]